MLVLVVIGKSSSYLLMCFSFQRTTRVLRHITGLFLSDRESQITRAEHVKQGLSRLLCLVPYELISLDLWTEIMPYWMEAINTDIPEAEYQDIRVVLT